MDAFKRDPVSSKVSQQRLAQRKDALNTKLAQLLQKQRSASAHGAAARFKRKSGTSSRIIGYRRLCRARNTHEVLDLASVPAGHTLLVSTWLFKIKYKSDADGNMIYNKHRARLVATGFQQRKGMDGKVLIIFIPSVPEPLTLPSVS